jgi:hypothetical protein
MNKVYLIKTQDDITRYKIGYTKRSVEKRIKEFKTGNSNDFQIVSVFESNWATKIEANLHVRFKSKNIGGEWFSLSEQEVVNFYTECQKLHDIFDLLSKNNTWVINRGGI